VSDETPLQPIQFETAEYQGGAPSEICAACKKQILDSYYRVGAHKLCATCAGAIEKQKDSHSAFVSALLYGGLTALGGLLVYSMVTITTNMNFALLAIGVGWAVGKMMRKGSRGVGGRRYQIVAALLTYAAVSVSAIPTAIFIQVKESRAKQEAQANEGASATVRPGGEQEAKAPPSLGAVVLTLIGLGLASPFLEMQNPVQGLIGLLIIFFGMRTAWRMMTGSALAESLSGPFPVSSGASA
jgi:hypothetical protein